MRTPCGFGSGNLQHEFSGHAPDFGVTGYWNNVNVDAFRQAVRNHTARAPQAILGTFRGTTPVTHCFSPTTSLWVAVDQPNTFVAGWRLYPSQVVDLLTKGDVT
jgi:hypothetical protein